MHRITSFFAPPTRWIALLRSPLFDQTGLTSLRKRELRLRHRGHFAGAQA